MEIQALRLLITEQELNEIATRETKGLGTVRDVSVRLSSAGVHVKGKYHMMMPVPFETLWCVRVQSGKVLAQLADAKVVGFGASMIKGLLMDMICETVQADGALQNDGDTLSLDLDQLLATRGFPARTNLTSVRCEDGRLLIESSLAPSSGTN
ncbi:MAG: hypothetical protein K2R98_23885 [Gemmataceae bacterium]|nr:hypothetical protein [Gemmataceae bacterium]